jgi:hypothetical protein
MNDYRLSMDEALRLVPFTRPKNPCWRACLWVKRKADHIYMLCTRGPLKEDPLSMKFFSDPIPRTGPPRCTQCDAIVGTCEHGG